ncbi:MAG: peptide chain release factor N(5)-glutamine methyltransferase [Gammaproteobacteria bacterium]|nr:peptide chain release factor N(5)-glutamine methyltransferase [Gammaproteobacteria bacterium]
MKAESGLLDAPRVGTLLTWGRQQLRRAEIDSAALDAELLLAFLLARERSWLFGHDRDVLTTAQVDQFSKLIQRRADHEPVAYLTGQREFWSLPLRTTPAVLIPRPETERLVELALEKIPAGRPATLVDLGTGCGAIALALAKARPAATLIAIERHPETLAVARQNQQQLALSVNFARGDWGSALASNCCDLIISNPPYIAEGDPHLTRGDVKYEPRQALTSGPHGLDDLGRITSDALRCLKPGGWLLMEHGAEQGEAVLAMVTEAGLTEASDQRDYAGLPRVIMARKP